MQVRLHPRTVNAFVLLGGLVRSRPIALGVPPQSGNTVGESGRRLGRDQRLVEFVDLTLLVLGDGPPEAKSGFDADRRLWSRDAHIPADLILQQSRDLGVAEQPQPSG